MTDETYNGWKNYPTWAVNLWLANDQGSYERWMVAAQDAHTQAHAYKGTHAERSAKGILADWLKDEIRDTTGTGEASLAEDLLRFALDCVDWYEVASAFLSDLEEVPA